MGTHISYRIDEKTYLIIDRKNLLEIKTGIFKINKEKDRAENITDGG